VDARAARINATPLITTLTLAMTRRPTAAEEPRYHDRIMARIGVFGGSFNPVHNGHVIMALCAREAAHLDGVLVVPAALSPHKQQREMLPSELRVACARAAFEGLEGFSVDTREVERGAPSYTVDTLTQLRRELPDDELFFILGGDALKSLPTWRDYPRLTELATFLWVRRPGPQPEDEATRPPPGLQAEPVPCPLLEISSSAIRDRRARGLPLEGWVPSSVARLLGGSGA